LRGQTKILNLRPKLKKKIKLTNEPKKKRLPISNELNNYGWDFLKIMKNI
jgi:hypothetical protein